MNPELPKSLWGNPNSLLDTLIAQDKSYKAALLRSQREIKRPDRTANPI